MMRIGYFFIIKVSHASLFVKNNADRCHHLAMESEEEVCEYGKKRCSKREDEEVSLDPRLVKAFVEQVRH